MNKSETATLLALAAGTDRRTVGDADVEAWHAIMTQALGEDVRFEDCRWALVEHYGQTRDYLTPFHIVEAVKKLRRTRTAKIPLPKPPSELVDSSGYPDPEDAEKYRAWHEWREPIIRSIANGTYMPDPPADVLRQSIAEVENADSAFASLNDWDRWLNRPPEIAPWPGAELPAVEDGRIQRDMSFIDEIADSKAIPTEDADAGEAA